MSSFKTRNGPLRLPDGYLIIPITPDCKEAVLKIGVLARLEPDPVGGHLVVVHDTADAKVFLGCIVDGSARIHEWVELWVQNTGALMSTASAARPWLSNAMLDDRWHRHCRALEQLDQATTIETGWETAHPLPTFLDLSAGLAVHPTERQSGTPWVLCTDDGLLQQKGLPSYGSSLHRYLYVPAAGPHSQFVPVTAAAPTNDATRSMAEVLGDMRQAVPFNPAAGLMLVRRHAPIGLETFVDILGGSAWDGLKHGTSVLEISEQAEAMKKDKAAQWGDGWLFLESHGRSEQLTEAFHLKLRLLADIVSSVHDVVHQLQRPLLNLSPSSWRVRFSEPGCGLPFLWTAKPVLSDPGEAISLAIDRADVQYYLPCGEPGTTIYRPVVASLPTKGKASVRIRQVLPETGDTTLVEGTFATQERMEMNARDLVWFPLALAHGSVSLHAHLEAGPAMARGEWRFRTVGQCLGKVEISDLHAAEGVPMPGIPFEVIPLLSSPCDLYSLAVMAVRVLLVNATTALPVALDETLSLGRQISTDGNASARLEERIRETFSKDSRWLESLGPHHLTCHKIAPAEALGPVPGELWWTTLAIVLRMFPGLVPESECSHYGDAEPGGLHKVFERTLADLDRLIVRTRSLVVSDWKANQEIASIIQKYLP